MEAHETPGIDWSHCNREQVLKQLEALSRKKLVPYAKTRLDIIPSPYTRSEDTTICVVGGIHCERLWIH
eukprot:5695343-Prorocentrum_lima.AAC.1